MFTGFTEDTFAFFAALRFNNNRAFFEENRATYENAVRGPLVALAEALVPSFLQIDPDLDVRTGRIVSRIYRDLRFSKDKTPYRDHMWLSFRQLREAPADSCEFYFGISAETAQWGCGFYHMMPTTMQTLRQKLIDEPKRVQAMLRKPAFADTFQVKGDTYVRQHKPPEGMPAPLGEIYRKKVVYAEHIARDMKPLYSPDLVDTLVRDFAALKPFYTFLRECTIKRIEE